MTSLLAERHVGTRPTLECAPSDGELSPEIEDDVRQVLEWAGLELDGWQESFLFESLRTRYDGKWAAFEVAGVVPRQNGKGAIQEARQLTGLFVLGEPLQIHTAHEFKTCSEHFLRVKDLIEGSDDLSEHVKIIRTGAGEQGVELRGGERLRFLARSGRSIRGFSANTIYFDEAFELSAATMGSVLPALSGESIKVPGAQVWYFSSAPHFESEFLHKLLDRAESDEPELFLRAWESESDTRLDDVEAWRRVNPAIDIRIDEGFIRNEMRALCSTPQGVSEFKRERLGIREGGDGEVGVLPMAKWERLEIATPPKLESVVYGLAVASDGTASAVGSAGRLPNGELYVDNVKYSEGTDWVLEYLSEDLYPRKRAAVHIHPDDLANSFIRPLEDAGVEVVKVGGRDYRAACGEILRAVTDSGLRHLGQKCLTDSVAVARKRLVGKEGGWVWVRPSAVDISPLKAATLALSGVASGEKFFMY